MAQRYKLSKEDKKRIQSLLKEYHKLFPKLKCKGECLEHIVAKAIGGEVLGGHDKHSDIKINNFFIQVKSGEINNKDILTISGHRLTRFKKDFSKINKFLSSVESIIISVPTKKKTFDYLIYEIDPSILKPSESWTKKGKSYYQVNEKNVILTISPSMSWQVWWKIPIVILKNSGNNL